MGDGEGLPFAVSVEARRQLMEFMKHAKEAQDRAHIPAADRDRPVLVWSIGTRANGVELGPEIILGGYTTALANEEFSFLIDGYRVWMHERTLELLRGRTLVWQCRSVPAPIDIHYCFWVEPEPDED
jgi:hypothetical protein